MQSPPYLLLAISNLFETTPNPPTKLLQHHHHPLVDRYCSSPSLLSPSEWREEERRKVNKSFAIN
jgi:hypothetical protein